MDTSNDNLTINETSGQSDNVVKQDVVKTKKAIRGRPRKYTKQNEKSISKPNRAKRNKHSQDLIKKGFNVCYALEEYIRATQQNL
jgi:hypothetical protein